MSYKFNLPINLSRLENERLKLVPFEENLEEWAELWVQDSNENLGNYDYLTSGPYADGAEYTASYKEHVLGDEKVLILAIILKAGTVVRTDAATGGTITSHVPDNTFAGISGLIGEPDRATADLGALLLTKFHRTFVGTHVNALILHYLLDPPEAGGLGLRRVQWQANASNEASVRMAKRLGFQLEGIIRWQQILPLNKIGSKGAEIDREGLPRRGWNGKEWGPGRHTAMLSLCWDDWINGGREHVDSLVRW